MPDFNYPITIEINNTSVEANLDNSIVAVSPEHQEITVLVAPEIIEVYPQVQQIEATLTYQVNTIEVRGEEIHVTLSEGGVAAAHDCSCDPRPMTLGYDIQGRLDEIAYDDTNKIIDFIYDGTTGLLSQVDNQDADWTLNLIYDSGGRLLQVLPV
jgi:hypothetical protein